MKTIYLIALFFICSYMLTAQVGINTTNPTADLQIIADPTPATGTYNGIIIPKVTALPTGAALPGAAQTGLLVYLDSNDSAEGVYSFNGVSYERVGSVPVQYTLWQAGDYYMSNINSYSNLNGIQTIFDPTQIELTGNVEIKLIIWVTDYASTTNFELQAYDVNGNGSLPILQTDLSYENNATGGFITSDWEDYNAGNGSGNIAQLILRGQITGADSDATIVSAYVLIRPNQ